jgi:hypothetical protein
MKAKIIVLIGLFFISFSSYSQSNCKAYYPFKEGTKFEITNYNKKGKKEGVVKYHVSHIEDNVATIEAAIFDAKNKEVTTMNYNVMCDGNKISIDFKSLMNPDLFKQYQDMDMEITGTNIELPNNLQVGQTLNDANMNMSINMGGITMNMSVNMLNRIVDKKESITTPAGTFDCFALSYDNEMNMGMKMKFKIKEWIAEGVGMIRSESYNKNDKLMGYSELTSFSQ